MVLLCVPQIQIQKLYTIYDYELKDHLLEVNDIRIYRCSCSHAHNKNKCKLTTLVNCDKCNVPTQIFIDFRSLLYHRDLKIFKLYKCVNCSHSHTPPCGFCLECKIGKNCIVSESFECNYTSDVICNQCNQFTTPLECNNLSEHLYNLKNPLFWLCENHRHKHKNSFCKVQTSKCCDDAIFIKDYTKSFCINVSLDKPTTYTCYDPSIWKDQSLNHFISFLRAVVNIPEVVAERYNRFETSNFAITNIKEYKSGKKSVVRQAYTGFPAKGIYQTSIISCLLPSNIILIPQKIYDIAKNKYDLFLVLMKRDPSFHELCMFVCKAVRNPDPTVDVIVVSGELCKSLGLDQDGDKIGVYLIPLYDDGYDITESFHFKLARMEQSLAMLNKCTYIGNARLKLSEFDLIICYRYANDPKYSYLFKDNTFFKATYKYGPHFLIEAGCSYYRDEYNKWRSDLIEFYKNKPTRYVGIDDILMKTNLLPSIVLSGAKPNIASLDQFTKDLHSSYTIHEKFSEMEFQMNRYIQSGQTLSQKGRVQFIALQSQHDLISIFGFVFINKYLLFDFNDCSIIYCFVFNYASLKCFVDELEDAVD